jgi:hypothetical protein
MAEATSPPPAPDADEDADGADLATAQAEGIADAEPTQHLDEAGHLDPPGSVEATETGEDLEAAGDLVQVEPGDLGAAHDLGEADDPDHLDHLVQAKQVEHPDEAEPLEQAEQAESWEPGEDGDDLQLTYDTHVAEHAGRADHPVGLVDAGLADDVEPATLAESIPGADHGKDLEDAQDLGTAEQAGHVESADGLAGASHLWDLEVAAEGDDAEHLSVDILAAAGSQDPAMQLEVDEPWFQDVVDGGPHQRAEPVAEEAGQNGQAGAAHRGTAEAEPDASERAWGRRRRGRRLRRGQRGG